jgi:hypothetical protein
MRPIGGDIMRDFQEVFAAIPGSRHCGPPGVPERKRAAPQEAFGKVRVAKLEAVPITIGEFSR